MKHAVDRWLVPHLLLFALMVAGPLPAQDSLNSYYAYPFSIGVGYLPMQPVGEVDQRATVNEFYGRVRLPVPALPFVQPSIGLGAATVDSDVATPPAVFPGGVMSPGAELPEFDPRDTWDHRRFFATLGLGFAHRMSREFELGVDLLGGVSHSFFERRVATPDGSWYPVGELGLLAGASGKITLNPSYNLSVDVTPTALVNQSLGNLSVFDGVYFGVGFGVSYRFGQDPDAPVQSVRAVRISEIPMPPVFAAMQSYYVTEPLATFTVTNSESSPISDVEISFNQPGFMDSPTSLGRVDVLEPGETIEVPLVAGYNGAVFATNGITPLTGEVSVTYSWRGRPVTQRQSVTYDLHDRNALTWDDDRKVAAFITPADSAIANYASFVRAAWRDDARDYLPDNLESALLSYHALDAIGLVYQPDPRSPFTEVQQNTFAVDSVSLPRETLRTVTGDCDDITVLFNAMLESTGVPTGFVTIPGHIYSAIDTGIEPREHERVHPDRRMTVEIDGSLWIFVEITLIGSTGFLEAWRTGMEQWREYEDRPGLRSFHRTADAQQVFRPVGLVETDLGLQYGTAEAFLRPARSQIDLLATLMLSPMRDEAEAAADARAWNRLGTAAARLGRFSEARIAFDAAAEADPENLATPLNRGALAYLVGDYEEALAAFRTLEQLVEARPRVSERLRLTLSLNLARTLGALGRAEAAEEYVAVAASIDPEEAARFRTVAATGGSGGARAVGVSTPGVLFLEEVDDEE